MVINVGTLIMEFEDLLGIYNWISMFITDMTNRIFTPMSKCTVYMQGCKYKHTLGQQGCIKVQTSCIWVLIECTWAQTEHAELDREQTGYIQA